MDRARSSLEQAKDVSITLTKTMLTFLFTDVEGSMRLWDTDHDRMSSNLAEHDRLIRQSVADASGDVFAVTGDGFGAVFQSADAAFRAASAVQVSLAKHPIWVKLRVRVGIHTGPAELRDGSYYGPTVNQCARLTSSACGGQVLASDTAIAALSYPVDALDLGPRYLKDIPQPMRIHQVWWMSPTRELSLLAYRSRSSM